MENRLEGKIINIKKEITNKIANVEGKISNVEK